MVSYQIVHGVSFGKYLKIRGTALSTQIHTLPLGMCPIIRTFADLKSRLTDIVELLDSCRKLFDLYDQIGSLKVDKRRKDWFQMPG